MTRSKNLFFNIVLVEPEIPNNTGNIGRTCVGTNSALHLVEPFGFEINDKQLRRAGLDYWPDLTWSTYKNFDQLWQQIPNKDRVFFMTTKSQKPIYKINFQKDDWFVFGKETKGLSAEILSIQPENNITLPMPGPIRSYNLANSVAITAMEGVRQLLHV